MLSDRLLVRTHKVTGLGINNYFSTRFSYPRWMVLPFVSGDTTCLKKALEEMWKIWTFAAGGSLLLIM